MQEDLAALSKCIFENVEALRDAYSHMKKETCLCVLTQM